ncbi:MAG TPA: hypothetical protein DCM51_01365 [Actinobacteria bacterium]|nr:hypothetical protein [Actinomycetota bacterium]
MRWIMERELDDGDGATLTAWLLDDTIPFVWIANTLRDALGVEIGIQSLKRHRVTLLGNGGGCICPRTDP